MEKRKITNEQGERRREKEKEIMPSGKVLTEERESNLEGKERGHEENEKLLRRKEMTGELEAGGGDERKNCDLKKREMRK
jgi:hypothetical protein